MIWTFLAGMVSGIALLIALILISDRSFLDLLVGRLTSEPLQSSRQNISGTKKTAAVGQ